MAEPFTLALSSGFFGMFAHAGFLAALREEGLFPRAWAGSSAGSLVAAAGASGVPDVLLRETMLRVQRKDFWDPNPGLRIDRAGLLQGARFTELLHELLPKETIEACEQSLAISVFLVPSSARLRPETVVLRSGDLVAAVRASCAFPGLFQPVPVLVDGVRRLALDGGIADRPGLRGTREGERVLYHHLLSQSPWRVEGLRHWRGRTLEKQVAAAKRAVPDSLSRRMVTLTGLPRLGPFRLKEAHNAYASAREQTKRLLDA
jgi:NTE family protein